MHEARDRFEAELLGAIVGLRADALSLTGDGLLSEDLVQETLMRAWRSRETFAPGTQMRRWLFVILRNCIYDERQKRRLDVGAAAELQPEAGMAPYNPLARLELADAAACYPLLPDRYRAALNLIVAQGLPYETAAARLGCSVNTLKSRVRRGRRDLLLLLEGARPKRRYQPSSLRATRAAR